MKNFILGALISLAVLAGGSAAKAANCSSLPYSLVNGTTADATQVMANFNLLWNCSNGNLAHNGVNSDITQITGLTTPLAPIYGGTGQTSSVFATINTWALAQTFSGANVYNGTSTFNATAIFVAEVLTAAPTTGGAGLNLAPGVAPTSPADGDLWSTTGGVYARINGVTQGPFTSSTAYSLISTQTASNSASVSWTAPPTTFTDLKLVINGLACTNSVAQSLHYIDTGSADTSVLGNNTSDTNADYGSVLIPSWQDHSVISQGMWLSTARPTAIATNQTLFNTSGSIATIYIKCATGTIATGSASLYGR